MSLVFNSTNVTNVIFNGVPLDELYVNGVSVWTSEGEPATLDSPIESE